MISIIPKPLSLKEGSGHFTVTSGVGVGGEFPHAQSKLKSYFERAGVDISDNADKVNIHFDIDDTMADEEYSLSVTTYRIVITAKTEKGAFYAVQTIRQASFLDTLHNVSEITIPNMEVEDKPRFSHRGFMLDVARHFYGMDTIKEFLEMMALNKMNIFHWHLTEDQGWRIEIKKYPELTIHGAVRKNTQQNLVGYAAGKEQHDDKAYGEGLFFTQDQVREIVEYAADLHINIIPEIDMPGHLVAAISCYPELSCEGKQIDVSNRWGVMDDIGCVGGGKLIPFVKDVLSEVCDLFPYNYVHIGGDEVPKTKWKKCPKCQAKIKELGLKNEEELQGWFNNQIAEFLESKGKNIVGWNEILKATTLSDKTIVQWWIHSAKISGVDKWLDKGNKIIMSPHPYIYADHFYSLKDLKKTYSIDLDTLGLNKAYEDRVLGIEMPIWTEYIRDINKLHFNAYPRLQAVAEINWTSKANKDFDDFEVRLATLNCIMDEYDINYAPREAYLCRGIKNWGRSMNAWSNWAKDTYSEFDKYSRKK